MNDNQPELPLNKRNILLVEDDALVRTALVELLRSWGAIVTSVDNAKAAMTLIADQTKRFDLLICDYHLGEGENGLSVLHESLRRYEHNVGVILISGEIQVDMEGSETIPLLRKPIGPDKLLATAQLQLGTRA